MSSEISSLSVILEKLSEAENLNLFFCAQVSSGFFSILFIFYPFFSWNHKYYIYKYKIVVARD